MFIYVRIWKCAMFKCSPYGGYLHFYETKSVKCSQSLTQFSRLIPGVHCEINIDDCTPFTDPVTQEPKCFNQGRCVDRVGGYHCVCPPGYVGERCEGDVNECLSNPCDPRGTRSCVQLTNNYRCECRTGYTGKAEYTDPWFCVWIYLPL